MKKSTSILIGFIITVCILGAGFGAWWWRTTNTTSKTQTTTAPETTNYATARTTNEPYICEFESPSFFGERNAATAEIQGENYHINVNLGTINEYSLPSIQHTRIDGTIYSWITCTPGAYEAAGITGYDCTGRSFDVEKINELYRATYDNEETPLSIPHLFESVPNEASCKKTDSVQIALPGNGITFTDETETALSTIDPTRAVEDIKSKVRAINTDIYLPKSVHPIFTHKTFTMDWQSSEHTTTTNQILFVYNGKTESANLESPSTFHELVIDLTPIKIGANAQLCDRKDITLIDGSSAGAFTPTGECELYATTPNGTRIFSQLRKHEDKEELIRHYFFNQGTTMIGMTNTNMSSYIGERTNYEYPPGSLEQLVDSFERATTQELDSLIDELYDQEE
jgi:hypothetical protein